MTMALTDDPRERLVALGNELLDAIYKEQLVTEKISFIEEVMNLPEGGPQELAIDKLVEQHGVANLTLMTVEGMAVTLRRQQKLKEYTSLRSTIQAMEKDRVSPHD